MDVAAALARSAKGDEQIRPLLADPRNLVRTYIFNGGLKEASADLITELTNTISFDSVDAHNWLVSDNPPPSHLLKSVAIKARSSATLTALTDPNLFPVDEATRLLPRINASYAEYSLRELTDLRPELIPCLLDIATGATSAKISKDSLITALSYSRHIFDQRVFLDLIEASRKMPSYYVRRRLLTTIAKNPNLSPETLQVIAKILKRSLADRAKQDYIAVQAILDTKAELGYLTSDWNALTDPLQITLLTQYIAEISVYKNRLYYPTLKAAILAEQANEELPTPAAALPPLTNSYIKLTSDYIRLARIEGATPLTATQLDELIAPELNPLGAPAWELFFSLAPSWNTSVAELVTTVKSTAG